MLFLSTTLGISSSVCLIQLSTMQQTMLVDVESFRRLEFSETEWLNLFQTMFASSTLRKLYGFAYESDLKTIVHNFPFIESLVMDNLHRLVCLRNAAVQVASLQATSDAVFRGEYIEDKISIYLQLILIGVFHNSAFSTKS